MPVGNLDFANPAAREGVVQDNQPFFRLRRSVAPLDLKHPMQKRLVALGTDDPEGLVSGISGRVPAKNEQGKKEKDKKRTDFHGKRQSSRTLSFSSEF